MAFIKCDFGYDFECGSCGEIEFFEGDIFQQAWAAAKESGWRAFKDDGEWCHSCPECAEKFRTGGHPDD